MDIAVELSRILITEYGDQQVIFLREIDGERTFPILIGISEAMAIDHRLKGHKHPRPMTHDLLASVINQMGGDLDRIVITDLREHTFVASIYIRQNGEVIEIDSRPSDAIALGVAFDTPLFVAEHVFEAVLDQEPTTPAERIEFLRQRMEILGEKIGELAQRLADDDFLVQAPEAVVDEHRRQLGEMQTEYDAIERVIKKLG